jgi:transcriptional regulator with XRE-family HTH domain
MISEKEKMIADRLLKIMKQKKITQVELANRLGVTQATISKTLKREDGYPLTDSYVKKICNALELDYMTVISVSSEIQPDNEDYERSLIKWYFEKKGIETVHYIVSCGVVYHADRFTNQQFTSDGGKTMHSLEEMREIEKNDQKAFEEDELNGNDEYYEITYKNVTKRYSAKDYDALIEKISTTYQNILDTALLF